MSPTQRLRGIAALSAAALATAGLAGAGVAADECTDDDCLADIAVPGLDELLAGGPSLEFIREMMEAQGLPQETIDQTMALYEQMGLLDGGGLADAFMKGESDLLPGQDLGDLLAAANPGIDDQTGGVAEGWPAKWYAELPELIAAAGGADFLTENVTLNFLRQAIEDGDVPAETLAQIEDALAQAQMLKPGESLGDLLAKAAPPEDQTGEAFAKVEVDGPGEDAFIKFWAEDQDLNVDQVRVMQAIAAADQPTLDAMIELIEQLDRE